VIERRLRDHISTAIGLNAHVPADSRPGAVRVPTL
jgi:hypothetical protein